MVESGAPKKPARFGYFLEKRKQDIYLTPEGADNGGEHQYTMIWMHGLGDSSEGFLDFFYSDDPIVPQKVRAI